MRFRGIAFVFAGTAAAAGLVACPDFSELQGGPTAAASDGGAPDPDGSLPIGADADADAGADPDAGADAQAPPPCDLTTPWGPASLILSIGNSNLGATLSEDELTVIYDVLLLPAESRRAVFTSQRAKIGAMFVKGSGVDTSSPTSDAYEPNLAPDGLTLFFTSNKVNAAEYHISALTRPSVIAAFTVRGQVAGLAAAGATDTAAFLLPTNDVFFTSTRGGGTHIYQATRGDAGLTYSAPSRVQELTSTASDFRPVLSRDERTIFFGSNRASAGALAHNIWTATRTSNAMPFSAPVPVTELNTDRNESPTWLSKDSCRLYFASDRADGTTSRIWVSTRGPAR